MREVEEVEVVEEVLACLEELINYTSLPAWTDGAVDFYFFFFKISAFIPRR